MDCAFTMAFNPRYDNLLQAVKEATNTGIKVWILHLTQHLAYIMQRLIICRAVFDVIHSGKR